MRARPLDAVRPPGDRPSRPAGRDGLHLRARHVGAPGRSRVGVPVRRARGGAPARGHRRARGQARSSRARLGGPAEPAAARGSPGEVRLTRPLDADHAPRGHIPRRDQPHGRNRVAGGADLRQQRPPHPRGGEEPRQRSAPRRGRDQGPAASVEGEHRRPRSGGVPQRARGRCDLDRLHGARRRERDDRSAVWGSRRRRRRGA